MLSRHSSLTKTSTRNKIDKPRPESASRTRRLRRRTARFARHTRLVPSVHGIFRHLHVADFARLDDIPLCRTLKLRHSLQPFLRLQILLVGTTSTNSTSSSLHVHSCTSARDYFIKNFV